MQMPTLLNSQNLKIPSLIPNSPFSLPTSNSLSIHSLPFFKKFTSLSRSVSFVSSYSSSRQPPPQEVEEDDYVIGDCVVFEEGVFEDPYLRDDFDEKKTSKKKSTKATIQQENLVPDKWKEAQVEINITKKERRKIAQQLEYGSRVVKRNKPVHFKETEGYLAYRSAKLSQLNPVVLDNPTFPIKDEKEEEKNSAELGCSSSGRVAPRNPRLAVYRGTLEEITDFFNSGNYEPDENSGKSSEGRRKLLTKEEKVLLNKRVPNLLDATSEKWLPLHTLAASGEFYLVDAILKHNVDINATDKDGLTALHKAIICKKQAVTNYLLRESANPFICDKEGATLMHYAVQTASSQTIKILLLYNVDINLPDDDGWTPLHLAVQTRRTDLVRLLLIKGADKTLKNRDGLTPLELCLYYGRDVRNYELIKLLKLLPKSK